MGGLALVLTTILVWLYARAPQHDTAGYLSNVAMLRQFKQIDAQWELNVLKARNGLATDYDALVDPLLNLTRLQQQLRMHAGVKSHVEAYALAATEDALEQAVQQKAQLIERFKSHNSILRNSLAFLPTAAGDIRHTLDQVSVASPQLVPDLSARVNDLLVNSLVYSRAVSADLASEVEADLALLATRQARLPASLNEQIGLFAAHVRTVLREQPIVDQLLADISEVPTVKLAVNADNLLGNEQRDSAERSERHRAYLFGFSAALAGLLLYAATSLVRSHAEINRVNQALLAANATLELRIDERTRELHATQGELMAAARQAGMAEIANNVLHNVGNVLNSVNVSAGLIAARIREAQSRKLMRVVELMDAHAADLGNFLARDRRGQLLPEYLGRLAQSMETEREGVMTELDGLVRSIDHIKDIVAAQQAHAGAACVTESADICALLDDALRISAGSLARHQVVVEKAFASIPPLLLDKQRLLQIAVNLVNNAKQAMGGVYDRPRTLTVSTELTGGTDDGWRLVVRVADSGQGIAPENMARIFNHGFTTRRDGHGFGLHSSVLAAKEMGGTLRAHSDGRDRGAIFTLELPVAVPEAPNEHREQHAHSAG
jgi:signal transduction histidine kinase